MDTADAFVRVATGDDEARDLRVYFVVKCREDIGREFYTTSVSRSLGGGASRCFSPRCADSTV